MLGDDNSLVAVVVLPALAGAAVVLVVGAMVDYEDESSRIAELEARVAELEAELEAERGDESADSDER